VVCNNTAMAATSAHTSPPDRSHIIYDSGASSNYKALNSNTTNVRPDPNPINIQGISGARVQSTHVGELNLPGLENLPSSAKIT
jgi:hypothetical protein